MCKAMGCGLEDMGMLYIGENLSLKGDKQFPAFSYCF